MITLLDGGLGQEIYKRSKLPAHPLWSIKVMMEDGDVVQEVHQDFIQAGARILTLNTYTATPTRLRRDGQLEWLSPLQAKAYELADAARKASGEPHGEVQLAGCLPPLQGSYSPESTLPYADCVAEYREIIALQPGVDLFIAETLSTVREGLAAAEAMQGTSKPLLLSFTLSDDAPNCLRSGERIPEMLEAIADLDLAGLLFNCSLPESITQALPELQASPFPYGAYANGFQSVKALRPGGTVDVLDAREDLGPTAYADLAMHWVLEGASYIGGCCEVGPDHIAELRRRIEREA